MSPQPTAAPSADRAAETSAQKQIRRAKELEKARGELQKKIGANRDFLRLMEANDELTEQEAAWLSVFYPLKEKGEQRSEEEIAATRKAREAARTA